MKKLYYAASLLALASLSVFTGCKKDTTPFPTKTESNGVYPDLAYTTPWFPTIANADGIFISAQVTDEKTVIISPFANMYEYGMVKIASGTGNFSSLLDGGAITLNDSVLVKSTALSYLSSISNYTIGLSNRISWNIAGNGTSVPAVTHTLSSANNPTYSYAPALWDSKWVPVIPRHLCCTSRPTVVSYTTTPSNHADSLIDLAAFNASVTAFITDSTFNATEQFSVPIKHYTTNADSVFIYMTDINGLVYKRTCLPTDSVASFKPNDFAGISYDLTSFKLQVNAINYQDTIHLGSTGKIYYFLKMASTIKYYQATK